MKILYLHQYFRTPVEGGAIRSFYISKAMQEAGHQVEVITTTNTPEDYTSIVEGVKVHYLSIYYSNHLSFTKRVKAFFWFYQKAYRKSKEIKGIDLIYATSTPLTVGLLGRKLKRKLGVKFVFEVRDLWPYVPIDMGIIRQKFLQKILYFLEKKIYKIADQIIGLSPMMVDYIASLCPQKDNIHCVPNMSDISFWKDAIKEKSENIKIIAYTGALGIANDVQQLLDLANVFKDHEREDYHWWVIGEGRALADLQMFAKEKKLDNVFFYENMSKLELKKKLKKVDGMYISFASFQSLQTCSPNKFFDALAAQKPVFINFEGWVKNEVESSSCGIKLPYDPRKAYQTIVDLTPKDWVDMQNNASILAEKFSLEKACTMVLDIVRKT